MIFTGKQGFPAKKFLGVIKAEIYNGYAKIVDEKTNKISLDFIEELLLTPSSKLYKTIAFFESLGFSTHLSAYNIKEEQIPDIAATLLKHGMTGIGEHGSVTLDVCEEILHKAL